MSSWSIPETGAALPFEDGAEGELVYTHLRHRAAPLLRFRSRDHVRVAAAPCACGRTAPRVRCIGRTDDMLIVRGVNLFPTAVREVVAGFAPEVSGVVAIRPRRAASSRRRRCRSWSSWRTGRRRTPALAAAIARAAARAAAGDDARSSWRRSARCRAATTSRSSSTGPRGIAEGRDDMRKLQTQGVHHITLVGADRQTSIDFWEGVLGMPFVFEQPNLDRARESHLYFDPGDGRLITVFTDESRKPDPTRTPTDIGCVHHLAMAVSAATFQQAVERLDERGIQHSGVKDRGFMDSIYFKDPLGLLIELAAYRFEPP